jgi:hypothetical protein
MGELIAWPLRTETSAINIWSDVEDTLGEDGLLGPCITYDLDVDLIVFIISFLL